MAGCNKFAKKTTVRFVLAADSRVIRFRAIIGAAGLDALGPYKCFYLSMAKSSLLPTGGRLHFYVPGIFSGPS